MLRVPASPHYLRIETFFLVVFQLGLVLFTMSQFQLEQSSGFLLIAPVIFGGFLVHAWLPVRLRLPFFLALSLLAIGVVLGYKSALILTVLACGLIGICHLPFPLAVRVVLLLVAGGLLVALRAEWITTRFSVLPALVIPVLGSMFMFRLVIYLYDIRHEKTPSSLWERLSYFFLLPNVCFLLFPVIDFQTFRRTYFNEDAASIYQKGLTWMARGMVHLLLYRLVYYHLVLSPSAVQDLGDLVQSMLATYLLYLRISGQFHLIIGVLCLFGFNLPETHHLYYFASGFNDYWRRINIYWKDFMMKIFYYPAFMQLRRWGTTSAMVLATIIVFVGTWILHSYQWFWLRGTFPITGPDILFWGILGGLVVVNSLKEEKKGRKRSLKKPEWTFRPALLHSAKVVGMFVLICLLWSLWSSHSLAEWIGLVSAAQNSSAGTVALVLLTLAGLVGAGVGLQYLESRKGAQPATAAKPSLFRQSGMTVATSLLLLALAQPGVQAQLGQETGGVIASLQETSLNRQDEERQQQGYYEGLLDTPHFTSALWSTKRPDDFNIRSTDLIRTTGDLLEFEHLPSKSGTYKELPFATNQWGMRDQEYAQAKPPGTFRIAMLGSSYTVGSGVEQADMFEARVEQMLNERQTGRHERFEILNFSVAGYGPLQAMIQVEQKVPAFAPDLVLFTMHRSEWGRAATNLVQVIQARTPIPYPYVAEIVARADVKPEMESAEIRRRLQPFSEDLLRWSFRRIVELCQAQGITAAAVYVPITEEAASTDRRDAEHMLGLAREAGFIVMSMEGAYGDEKPESVWLAPYDTHANAYGHRLLAERLYRELLAHEPVLKAGLAHP